VSYLDELLAGYRQGLADDRPTPIAVARAALNCAVDPYLRNAKLQLSAVLAPGDEVPGLYLHPDHRRRLRRPPVRSDPNV
jgi:hypothetical protein